MEKLLFTTILCLSLTYTTYSQKAETYTASNGMIYTVGDTITLGVGSEPDGKFRHIYSGMARTIFATLAEEADYDVRLPEFFQGAPVVIRKIKANDKETLFVFDTDGWGGFVIDIEKATSVCEVAYCRPQGFLTQQEFEKLVRMYQAVLNGDITPEKFEALRTELVSSGSEPAIQEPE
jgi:hypothetical protein